MKSLLLVIVSMLFIGNAYSAYVVDDTTDTVLRITKIDAENVELHACMKVYNSNESGLGYSVACSEAPLGDRTYNIEETINKIKAYDNNNTKRNLITISITTLSAAVALKTMKVFYTGSAGMRSTAGKIFTLGIGAVVTYAGYKISQLMSSLFLDPEIDSEERLINLNEDMKVEDLISELSDILV